MSLDKIKIQKTAQGLIGYFDPAAKIEVEVKNDACRLNIKTEFSGVLIGRAGQNLEALEHILRLMLFKESEEFIPVVLDIAGYRAGREQEIARMAEEMAERTLEKGEDQTLPPMNSFERRLVHLALEDFAGIKTESVGEEPARHVVISNKLNKGKGGRA